MIVRIGPKPSASKLRNSRWYEESDTAGTKVCEELVDASASVAAGSPAKPNHYSHVAGWGLIGHAAIRQRGVGVVCAFLAFNGHRPITSLSAFGGSRHRERELESHPQVCPRLRTAVFSTIKPP
jgi:hypothetical protein